MAITQTLNFTGLNVNGVSYSLHLTESAEITVETDNDTVDDGQTLTSAYRVNFSAKLYESNVLGDSNVYSNTQATPKKVFVQFTGGTGSPNIKVESVIVNAEKVYDENRSAVRIFGSKKTTSMADLVDES